MKESKIPKFRRCVLQNFPFIEEDFDALTDYELLCKVVQYLNMVIDKVNKLDGMFEELNAAFVQLKNFVDNYFDNLDVQEEIDNKLEEMAEGGQLATIIAQFLAVAPVLAYDTVNDMQNATNLNNGCIARTLGFYNKNDFGGAYYSISNTGTADGHKIIALGGGLYAHLIVTPETTVNQYGAYGDGTHDDYAAIQAAILDNQFGTVKFADCTYAIGTTLKTYVDNSKKTSLILEPTTTIKALNNLTSLIELGGLGGNNDGVTNRFRAIVGGIFDATNCDAAIAVNPLAMGNELIRVEIINAGTYGIYVPEGSGTVYSSDMLIDECNITCTSSGDNAVAVYCERPDNEFCNTKVNQCKKGFYFKNGGQRIINVHGLQVGGFEGSTFIHFAGGALNFITNCYCDTFETFLQSDTYGDITITNSCYYSYVQNKNVTLFKFGSFEPRITISNCSFDLPAPETKHKGIVFTGTLYSLLQAYNYVDISNNKISRTNDFVEGDLLIAKTNYIPYWSSGTNLSTSQWVKLGYVVAGTHYYDININLRGYKFNANFLLERFDGVTYLTTFDSIKSTTASTIELGVKYIGVATGFPVYALYVRQKSGTALKSDITIYNNNPKSPLIPTNWSIQDIEYVTETMNDSYDI